jgi:hypothetical protein
MSNLIAYEKQNIEINHYLYHNYIPISWLISIYNTSPDLAGEEIIICHCSKLASKLYSVYLDHMRIHP